MLNSNCNPISQQNGEKAENRQLESCRSLVLPCSKNKYSWISRWFSENLSGLPQWHFFIFVPSAQCCVQTDNYVTVFNARFPPFRCRSSFAVSPFPLAVAVSVSVAAAVAYLFALYGCNRAEFFYVIFTEQRNFTTAERRNGNRRTATRWWKPGISLTISCKAE